MCLCVYIFFKFFSIIGYYKIPSIVPSAIQLILLFIYFIHNSQSVSSVAQSCPTLCDPMDCSMPGFSVHHQLLELAQTHVHRVSDAIQPSHLLSSPFPLPAFYLFQHQGLSR